MINLKIINRYWIGDRNLKGFLRYIYYKRRGWIFGNQYFYKPTNIHPLICYYKTRHIFAIHDDIELKQCIACYIVRDI